MRSMAEVTELIPGIDRRFVYYLEERRYINPDVRRVGRRSFRSYSDGDILLIRKIWHYCMRGMSPADAHELATRAESLAIVEMQVGPRDFMTVMETLKKMPVVRELTPVLGACDIIAKLSLPKQAIEDSIREVGIVASALFLQLPSPRSQPPVRSPFGGPAASMRLHIIDDRYYFCKDKRSVRRNRKLMKTASPKEVQAWLIITVPATKTGGVVEKLKAFDEVEECGGVYGDVDVIARVAVDNLRQLDDLVMHRVQDLEGVVSTRTFTIINDMYWRKDTS